MGETEDGSADFDQRFLEACLVLYERMPNERIVTLVRVWIMNGDDPVANAQRIVDAGDLPTVRDVRPPATAAPATASRLG